MSDVPTPDTRSGKFIYRHYRSHDWCPYQGVILQVDDKTDAGIRLTRELMDGLVDGDEIEIVVRKTGRKRKGRYELVQPHTYKKVRKLKSKGCPECQKAGLND